MSEATVAERIKVEVDAALEAGGHTWLPVYGERVSMIAYRTVRDGVTESVEWLGVATGANYVHDGKVMVECRFGEDRISVPLRQLWSWNEAPSMRLDPTK